MAGVEGRRYVPEETTKAQMSLTSKRKGNRIKQSGALTNRSDPKFERRGRFAESYYQEVRERNRDFEISAISKNTNTPYEQVEKAFAHVFELDHLFADGSIHQFYPDYYMAQSWMRLREGKKIYPHNLILLKHELMEAEIMGADTTIPYEPVHEYVSKTYDYVEALKGYLRQNNLD